MRALRNLIPLLAICVSTSCDGGVTAAPAPGEVQAVTAGPLAGTVGSALPAPLAVRVLDERGKAMAGVQVSWSVTGGGGTLDPAASTTDAAGLARSSWTLGPGAGAQGASAAVGGLAPVTFTAAAGPDVPALAVTVGGGGQSGEVAGVLLDSLAVRVADRFGNPVPNVSVAWSVTGGGGTVAAAGAASNDSGLVKARWTLGPALGPQSVEARAAGAAGAPALFRATAETRPGSIALAATGGDAQAGTAGRAVPAPLEVRAVDRLGRGVSGLSVAWEVTEGGGTLAPAVSTTDSAGVARTLWTLGPRSGPNTARATGAGVAVVFRAAGAAGPPAGIFAAGGDGQSGAVGAALPTSPVVRIADANGNPVAGAAVQWTVSAGGGTVAPAAGTTDEAGLARAAWTLGTAPGVNTVQARSADVPASLAVFHATAVAGPPATLGRVAGDGQSASAGSALPAALAVRVADRFGNPLGGVAVGWSAAAGGGALDPASSATGPDGVASARWTLGAATVHQAAHAAVGGLAPVAFGATATSGVEVAALRVTPAAATVQVGSMQTLVVTQVDAAGADLGTAPAVRWTSSDPAVARIDFTESPGWRVLGVGPGTATLTAAMSERFGTATITVVDQALLGADDFRANTLGSYTAHPGPGGTWTMGDGVLVGSGASGDALLTRNGVSLRDGWVETVTAHAEDAGLVLRLQGDGRYYLLAIRDDAWPYPHAGRNLELFRVSGGSATPLRQHTLGWPRGTRATIRLQAVGSTLSVYVDGRLAFSLDDAAIPGPGALGVRHRGAAAAATDRFLALRWGTP
ncbi:MAG: Ig-like domain-containing protein [Longimicrobiaceae bacterium]